MKYEDFEKVKNIVDSIKKYELTLEHLNKCINVKVFNDSFLIMTIGAYPDCEHECKKIAINFRQQLITHYEDKIQNLREKLEMF